MIAPRWRKVIRDVFQHSGRSLLAVLAMAAGVFEIGALLYKYAVLQPVLTTMYGRTRPASATLVTDRVDDGLVEVVRRVPGVADAEARPVVMARVRVGHDEWRPAAFSVIRDFDRQRMDTFTPQEGAWPPKAGEVLLERSALSVARARVGDSLVVRTPDGTERTLRIAGTVHAAGLPPAWMEHFVPGFVSWRSVIRSDPADPDPSESAQLRIVADHPLDEGYVREVADSVKAVLEARGHPVSRVTVPTPGRHPHADQMDAFLYLLAAFGVLSFLLSAALVASMIHALLAEQVREVGILKAIGATTRQIAAMYLGQVSILAVAALAVGIPLGIVVGGAYARFAAGILNANLTDAPFPLWVVLVEVVVGLLVPLAFALGPVLRGARITVREALQEERGAKAYGNGRIERALLGLSWVPRPLVLSLRSTFLRRGRLTLTIGMLALGGASFLSALNVAGAWQGAVRRDFERRRYDLTVVLAEPTPIAEVEAVLRSSPEVDRGEYWADAAPYLVGPRGVAGAAVPMVGLEPGTRLIEPAISEGRWLQAADSTGVVVNRAVLLRNPSLAVGSDLEVRAQGRTLAFPIVGIAKELAPMPAVYGQRAAVLRVSGRDPALTRTVRVVARRHDMAGQRAAAASLERAFAARGMEVTGMHELLDQKQGILDHLVIILAVLTFASSVVVLVGTLGLASTLVLSVVQRTREIGILGAIGARPIALAGQVWVEALLIGLLSWAAAVALAAPLSAMLEAACGQIFFKTPLDFYMSPAAIGIWLLLVVVLATLASIVPARRAAHLTVREALAHA